MLPCFSLQGEAPQGDPLAAGAHYLLFAVLGGRHDGFEFETGDILIAGGVSANSALRGKFTRQRKYKVHIPPLSLCTDNAAMIAGAGCYRFAAGHRDDLEMDAAPTWSIADL